MHSYSKNNTVTAMHLPLSGYVIAGVCTGTSILFYILGVISTVTVQWCYQRQKRCRKVTEINRSPKETQGESSEPVYAECTLPTLQEFNTYSNVAYEHPKVRNMYIYAY